MIVFKAKTINILSLFYKIFKVLRKLNILNIYYFKCLQISKIKSFSSCFYQIWPYNYTCNRAALSEIY